MRQSNEVAARGVHSDQTDDEAPMLPDVAAMQEEADEWLVEWADGTERRTTLTGVAWYARAFDDDATVTPLPER